MTVNDVLNYNKIIKTIIESTDNISALVKFKLLGMCKQFEPIVSDFETIRQEKIKQYSNGDEGGNIGIIMPNRDNYENEEKYTEAVNEYDECIKKFSDDMTELLNSETSVQIKKFKAEEIMNAGIPVDYLMAIYDLVEE